MMMLLLVSETGGNASRATKDQLDEAWLSPYKEMDTPCLRRGTRHNTTVHTVLRQSC